jgi:hypothetical protein
MNNSIIHKGRIFEILPEYQDKVMRNIFGALSMTGEIGEIVFTRKELDYIFQAETARSELMKLAMQ